MADYSDTSARSNECTAGPQHPGPVAMRPRFGDEDALGLFPSPPTNKVSKTGPETPPDRLLINCNCIKRSPTMRFVKFLQPGDRIFFGVHGSSAFSKTLLAPIKLQWSPRKRCHFVLLTTLHLGKWSSGEPTKSSTPYPNYTGKGLSYYQKKVPKLPAAKQSAAGTYTRKMQPFLSSFSN